MNDIAVIIFIGVVILVVWFSARKGRTARAETDRQREAAREASDSLKKINKMLGYPEGQGPTGVMVDGEYRIVNVGHTERKKTIQPMRSEIRSRDFCWRCRISKTRKKKHKLAGIVH